MTDSVNKTTKENTTKQRRARTPLGGGRTILEVRGKEPGFHYAWIEENDVGAALDAGYEPVRHPVQVGSKRIDVGRIEGGTVIQSLGGGKIGHLMRQPQEFYDEDRAFEQEKVNEQERARVRDTTSDGLSGSIKVKTS